METIVLRTRLQQICFRRKTSTVQRIQEVSEQPRVHIGKRISIGPHPRHPSLLAFLLHVREEEYMVNIIDPIIDLVCDRPAISQKVGADVLNPCRPFPKFVEEIVWRWPTGQAIYLPLSFWSGRWHLDHVES
jgi:hypothetical protein